MRRSASTAHTGANHVWLCLFSRVMHVQDAKLSQQMHLIGGFQALDRHCVFITERYWSESLGLAHAFRLRLCVCGLSMSA